MLPIPSLGQSIRLICLAAFHLIFFTTLASSESAVEQDERRHLFEYEAYMANGQKVGPEELNAGLMGDFINLDKGALSFSNTDIDLVGNFPLPVRLTRTISSDKYSPKFILTNPMSVDASRAVWGLDLSYITLPTIKPSGTVGCLEDFSNLERYNERHVSFLDKYYDVPRFYAPGGSGMLLKTSKKSPNTKVFGKNSPEYTNNESWRINQTKKNGKCTWTAQDKKGNIYSFDQAVVLSNFRGIRRHAVVITKVTDINGNWVKYSYDDKNGNRLSRIHSSDGREINFHYNTSGRLSRAVANGRTWTYTYATEKWWGYTLVYLKKVTLPDGRYWEYDALKGVSAHIKNRCVFGSGAYVRHPSGVKGYFKTEKIVNFAEARPPFGYVGASQRAACLPSKFDYETDFYERPIRGSLSGKDQAKFEPLDDGKSKYGIFVTFFSSAPIEKKLVNLDNSESVWKYIYKEGDLYNPDMTKNSFPTVHKQPTVEVAVNTKLGKVRHVIDPLGTKYEYIYGRSLKNTGDLLSERVYEKGSSVAISDRTYEYVQSTNPLGYPWYQSNVNVKKDQHWTRTAKSILTLGDEKYTTKNEFDDRGFQIKISKWSTVQDEIVTVSSILTHKTDIWVLGLPISISVNGKEFVGVGYDTKGRVISESKFGNPLRRYKLNDDGTLAASRNGKNETTFYESYKRGTPQKITLPNGAVHKFTVDNNGWMTKAVTPSGFTVTVTHNKAGWVTKVDRPTGYADTFISYEETKSGLVQSERTGDKITRTTLNGFHKPTKIEIRDATGQIPSVYVLREYDKLQRTIFESIPSLSSTETAGIRTSYDVLNREVEKKETKSPFSTTKIEYLTDNRTRTTDAKGNMTIVHRSGFSSPMDGYETLIEKPNGLKIYFDHDNWHNVTSVRQVGGGQTLTNTYQYDARFQVCLQITPEVGREFFGYNSIDQLVKSQKNAPADKTCETPPTANIKVFNSSDDNNTSSPTSSNTTNTTNTTIITNTTNTTNQKPSTTVPSGPGQCKNCEPTLWRAHSETIENITYYAYDSNGSLVSIDYPVGTEDIKHYYDKSTNLIKTVRGNSTILYTYGLQNELKSETLTIDGTTYRVEYTFNNSGGLTSYKTPNNRLVTYKLDAFNQITSITIGNHTYVGNATYHPSGLIKSALYDNGYTITNSLNKRTFLDGTKLSNPLGSLFDFSISYGKGHQITSITDNLDSTRNQSFTYDELNRLVTANGSWGKGAYSFDLFDNILSKTLGTRKVELEYDKDTNRPIKSSDTGSSGTRLVSHDNRGNVSGLGALNFTHDHSERITAVSGTIQSSYGYNGNLYRVKSVEGNEIIHWFYSRSGKLLFSKNVTTGKSTEYVSFESVSSLRIDENGVSLWVYSPPFVGVTVALNQTGEVEWQEIVTPYGETIETASENNNKPAYANHVRDSKTGLSYMKARFYDPIIGRFLSPDPVTFRSGGVQHLNRYLYVSGDPINYWDPFGLAKVLLQVRAYRVIPWLPFFRKFRHTFIEFANPNDPSDRYIFRGGVDKEKRYLGILPFLETEFKSIEESKDGPIRHEQRYKRSKIVETVEIDIGDEPKSFDTLKELFTDLSKSINETNTIYLVFANNSNSAVQTALVLITGDDIEYDDLTVEGDYVYTGRTSTRPGSRITEREKYRISKPSK